MSESVEPASYEFEGFRLDPGSRRLLGAAGEPIRLRSKAFDVLLFLVEHAGQVVAKNELLQAVWPDAVVEENNLNQTVSTLRQVLGDDRLAPRFIATITGRGYQFVAEVQQSRERTTGGLAAPAGLIAEPPTAVSRKSLLIGAAAALVLAAVVVALLKPQRVFDFTRAELITDSLATNTQPALSPDGRQVAFVSDRSGVAQIWLKDLDRGGDALQLTFGELAASYPEWSPSGETILYNRLREDGEWSIWSVDPLGVRPLKEIRHWGSRPRFCRDGSFFVYAIGRSLWVADADGESARQIEGVPFGAGFEEHRSPDLSPDCRRVVFVHATAGPAGNLYTIPVEGGEAEPVPVTWDQEPVGTMALLGAAAANPRWSPDGEHIIFTSSSSSIANLHLYRIPIAGGRPEQLTQGVGGNDHPSLSADGSRLLYTNRREERRLMRTNPWTGEHVEILQSRRNIILPRVSPDGFRVAYFSLADDGIQIYTIAVDGSNRTQRTFDPSRGHALPDWAGDDALYYYSDGRIDATGLYHLNLTDGRETLIDPDFNVATRLWLLGHDDDRMVFYERNLVPGVRRTVVRDVGDGTEHALARTLSPTDWSRDGETILGFSQVPDETLNQIIMCPADGRDECTVLSNAEGPIVGREPRWTMDERRIFLVRSNDYEPAFRQISIVDNDGSNLTPLIELGPFDVGFSDFAVGVDHEDHLIWNQYELIAEDIWMVNLD